MNETLSTKLNNLTIRLTELSDILKLSRPTLYKYIELYENGNHKNIINHYKEFFDFIASSNCKDRQDLYLYIHNGGIENGVKKEIFNLLKETEDKIILKKILKILKGD